MEIGSSVTLKKTVTEKDIEMFAELSFDRNPIHFSDEFASKTMFGKRIAHGMISVALVSGALTELVGSGNIWLSAKLEFCNPVYIGDEIICKLVVEGIEKRCIYEIKVDVRNGESQDLVQGTVRSMKSV